MSTKDEIQSLLRFLSQDAKVPLPAALGRVKDLQKVQLTSVESLAKSNLKAIQAIFMDEKLAKQVFSAAKRTSKKRAPGADTTESPSKRKKILSTDEPLEPTAIEASLTLPSNNADEEELAQTVLHTNRAPLVLAFAVTLLKLTMPGQPLSSRLSLAQAVVSVNSRSKAVSLGIEKGASAEEDGWGQGQPTLRIMGRDIRVMKRWGYDWNDGCDDEPALWGLNLEALRSSNGPVVSGTQDTHGSGLPIYTAQSARAYLTKSFAAIPSATTETKAKKKSAIILKEEKEQNLGKLLRALDMLYASWAHVLGRDELDRRAWAWYVAVRPDVQNGIAGWGGKGEVKLSKILELRRES